MATYQVKLTGKRQVAEGTMEFQLSKPEGFSFRAGQFFDIILPHQEGDKKGDYVHGFSFVNAPFENYLAAATRMRGSIFKNAIGAMPVGSDLSIEAVWGSFTLPKKEVTRPVVFLIGGIGITPVRSMVAQATHDHSSQRITLLYANRTPAQAAFVDDLQQLALKNPHFTFVPVYTDVAETSAGAERGTIDAAMVKRHVGDTTAPLYYLSGPAGMVRAMRDLLVSLNVDEDDIKTEEFDGY